MKVIGISSGFGDAEGFKRNGVNDHYIEAVIQAGAVPMILPVCENEAAVKHMIQLCDGVILSGGVDLHPSYYGEEVTSLCEAFDVLRDCYEWHLLDGIKQTKKPVLGICRGAQILNVYFGGTLYQDLSMKKDSYVMHRQLGSRGYGCHQITVAKNSFLVDIYHSGDLVNSYHHQAIKQLAPSFKTAALSLDGVVEAFENDAEKIYAVQFHPELMILHDAKARRLFQWFIERIDA